MESSGAKSSLFKERRDARLGAVVFVVDDSGRFFVIKELENNSERKRNNGDISTFCESRNKKIPPEVGYTEGPLANLRRGLVEETGIPEDRFKDVFDFSKRKIWETGFVDGVWATVMVVRCKDPKLFSQLFGTGRQPDEIEAVGWKTLDEFMKLSPLRPGVVNILGKFKDEIFDK